MENNSDSPIISRREAAPLLPSGAGSPERVSLYVAPAPSTGGTASSESYTSSTPLLAWPTKTPALCDGGDFFPELICAAVHPWFSIWKLSSRFGLELSNILAGVAFILTVISWIFFIIATSENGRRDSVIITSLFGVLGVLSIAGIVSSLRGTFRSRTENAGGSALRDCVISIPWVFGLPFYAPTLPPALAPKCAVPHQVGYAFQLALMLEATSGGGGGGAHRDAVTGAPRNNNNTNYNNNNAFPPRTPGSWSTPLFGCKRSLEGDLPLVNVACLLPQVAQARNLKRLNQIPPQRMCLTTLGFTGLALLPDVISFIAETAGGANAALDCATILLALPSVVASAWLRFATRRRRGIVAACGIAEDFLTVFFCWGCALAQHDRELALELGEEEVEGSG